MGKLFIIVDYRKTFYSSISNARAFCSMDVDAIVKHFKKFNFDVHLTTYTAISDYSIFKGAFVLYQSSEDENAFYKGYIEDIILAIELAGGILIPRYELLRAHHNKVMMELLRKQFIDERLKTIKSRVFSIYDEAIQQNYSYPVVIKKSTGSGSSGVRLANSMKELKKTAKKFSYSASIKELFKEKIKRVVIKNYVARSLFRKKFIIQNFIPDLSGDYKVLFFKNKYFAIYRENRKNDFRASGSGRIFEADLKTINNLLSFAELAVSQLNSPVCSLDIGFDGSNYHLIEFQCITFGPLTLQNSKYYFIKNGCGWEKVDGESDLELEFCRSVHQYILEQYPSSAPT